MLKNQRVFWVALCLFGTASSAFAADPSQVDGVYQITSAEDFAWLSGKTVNAKLVNNITITAPLTSDTFSGSLIGERAADGSPLYTITLPEDAAISGITFASIFRKLTGTVKDIRLEIQGSITGTGTQQVGGLAGSIQAGAQVENTWISISGSIKGGNNVGGLAGNLYTEGAAITVKGCVVEISGSLTSTGGDGRVGGLAGGPNINAASSITDNVVILRAGANLSSTVTGGIRSSVGGLIGGANTANGTYTNNTILIEAGAALTHASRMAGVMSLSEGKPAATALAGCRLIKASGVAVNAFHADVAGYSLPTSTFETTAAKAFSSTRKDSPFTPAAVVLQAPELIDPPAGWSMALSQEDPTQLIVTGPVEATTLAVTAPYYLREANAEAGITAVSERAVFQFEVPLPALVWSGAAGANWSPGSWSITGGDPAEYTDGADVVFEDIANADALTITASGEAPRNIAIDITATAYTFTTNAPVGINATGKLTKRGIGSLTFTGAHAFGEGITMENGTLNLNGSVNASAIQATGGALVVTPPESVTTLTLSTISGSAPLTKNGSGTLTLAGENTYTGKTVISGGTLHIAETYRVAQKVADAAHIRIAPGARLSGAGGASIEFETPSTATDSPENKQDIFLAAGGGTTLAGGALVIPSSGTFTLKAGISAYKNIGFYLTPPASGVDSGRIRITGHFYWPGATINATAVAPADVPVCLVLPASRHYYRNYKKPFLTIPAAKDGTDENNLITPEALMTKLRIRRADAPGVDLKNWSVEQRTEEEEGVSVHNYYLLGPQGIFIIIY